MTRACSTVLLITLALALPRLHVCAPPPPDASEAPSCHGASPGGGNESGPAETPCDLACEKACHPPAVLVVGVEADLAGLAAALADTPLPPSAPLLAQAIDHVPLV